MCLVRSRGIEADWSQRPMTLFCAFYHLEIFPVLASNLGAVSLSPYTDPWWWLLCG